MDANHLLSFMRGVMLTAGNVAGPDLWSAVRAMVDHCSYVDTNPYIRQHSKSLQEVTREELSKLKDSGLI